MKFPSAVHLITAIVAPAYFASAGNLRATQTQVSSTFVEQRELASASDAFTVIFVSDMETDYRGHTTGFSHAVVNYIKTLKDQNIFYDGAYANVKVATDLVIHGGDISDGKNGAWSKQGSGASDYLYYHVWQQLYDAGIPLISGLGNHDFNPGEYSQTAHAQAMKFVGDSLQKTQDLVGSSNFAYTVFNSKEGGPALYKAEYRGVQIGHMNYQGLYKDGDGSQFQTFDNALDRSKKTIFFSHFPLRAREYEQSSTVENLISQFSNSAHFSGHVHHKSEYNYGGFTDYTAAYPHPWEESSGNGKYADPGFYAALVSPTSGVLQVKNIQFNYQAVTQCWSDNTVCVPGISCGNCCHSARNAVGTKCGGAKYEDGTLCGLGTTCDNCKNEQTYWWSKAMTACGEEPKWEDGTLCGDGTTCNACKNRATYWWSKVMTACGEEPKWADGTRCLAGSSCNACKNGYSWWDSKVAHFCGQEPCWNGGTVCGSGTTCNNCCSKDADCPWYQFGVCTCK